MLFAIVLGIIVGAASVVLVQQWLRGDLLIAEEPVRLPHTTYPRLAPPRGRRAA